MADAKVLLLFDGECGLCQRVVRFVLRRDRRERFVFAPLQGRTAAEILPRHGLDPRRLDTFHLVIDRGGAGERVLSKGRAALRVCREIGVPWRLAVVFGVLPTAVLDFVYDRVAANRTRAFGRSESCLVPDASQACKFLN